jgi:hypothetical protein
MGSDHEAEIRASVGAHHDLGSGYDDVVAEGLVERIGEEIDKRIDARLRRLDPQSARAHQGPGGQGPGGQGPGGQGPGGQGPGGQAFGDQAPQPGYEVPPPGYQPAPGYQPTLGSQATQGYQAPLGYQPPPGYQAPLAYYQPPPPTSPAPIPPWPTHRSVAATFIALGSMGMGVAATAVVAHASNPAPGAQAIMVLLIWTAIAVINVAYARRR